jgi:hypothetical protein
MIYVEDFFYWIIAALVMFAIVYLSNDGELRGYIFPRHRYWSGFVYSTSEQGGYKNIFKALMAYLCNC